MYSSVFPLRMCYNVRGIFVFPPNRNAKRIVPLIFNTLIQYVVISIWTAYVWKAKFFVTSIIELIPYVVSSTQRMDTEITQSSGKSYNSPKPDNIHVLEFAK